MPLPPEDPPFPVPDTATISTDREASELADWIDAEPLPALEHYRDELHDLAAEGQPDTEPVTDRLVDVIAALNATGDALRDDHAGPAGDGLPSPLAAVLARCTEDIVHAQEAVALSRRLVERGALPRGSANPAGRPSRPGGA